MGLHGLAEHPGPVHVVVEHVQAGTGRRQQYRVTGLRFRRRPADRVGHVAGVDQRHAAGLQGSPQLRRVAADQHHGARVLRHWCRQVRKILTLAVAAQDHHELAFRPKAVQCCNGGADVRALAVVEVLHVVHHTERLDAVGLAPVFAQAVQHRRQRATGAAGQRQRGQRVDRVVAPANAQGLGGDQALDEQVVRLLPLARLVGRVPFHGAHQPGHAVDMFQAEIPGSLGQARAERGVKPLRTSLGRSGQHRHHRRVVAVEQHHRLPSEYACLGLSVRGHRLVPVQMVLGQVQHAGDSGLQPRHRDVLRYRIGQLETRQFDDPDLGQLVLVELFSQRVEQRGADVAGRNHALAGALDQLRSQRGDGRLAVGAGHGQHAGLVVARLAQVFERLGKQVELAADAERGGFRRGRYRGHLRGGQSRTLEYPLRAGLAQQRGIERGADESHGRQFRAQLRELRWRLARIGDGHLGTLARTPARHRQAGRTQAQDQHGLVLQQGGHGLSAQLQG